MDNAFFFSNGNELLALVVNVEFSRLDTDLVFQNGVHEDVLINEKLTLVGQIEQSELYLAHVVIDVWWNFGAKLHKRLKIGNSQTSLSQIDIGDK